jgi:hypothetical protein
LKITHTPKKKKKKNPSVLIIGFHLDFTENKGAKENMKNEKCY